MCHREQFSSAQRINYSCNYALEGIGSMLAMSMLIISKNIKPNRFLVPIQIFRALLSSYQRHRPDTYGGNQQSAAVRQYFFAKIRNYHSQNVYKK